MLVPAAKRQKCCRRRCLHAHTRTGERCNLSVREDRTKGVYVEGATECCVSNIEEVKDVLDRGQANRAIAETSV